MTFIKGHPVCIYMLRHLSVRESSEYLIWFGHVETQTSHGPRCTTMNMKIYITQVGLHLT